MCQIPLDRTSQNNMLNHHKKFKYFDEIRDDLNRFLLDIDIQAELMIELSKLEGNRGYVAG